MTGYVRIEAALMMLLGTQAGWVIGTLLYHHWAVCT